MRPIQRTNPRTDRGRGRLRTYAAWLLALALVAVAATGGAAASPGVGTGQSAEQGDDRAASDEAFVVALEDDGDATVTVRVAFDLTDEAERAAFDSLRENETKRDRLEARTEQRFRTIAAEAASETGREMTVENVRTSFETVDGGDRGVVSVAADWRGLAATADGTLRVTEPFASGFTADRPVVLELPDGYELAASDPTPADRTAERAVWDANTSFEGYEAAIEPADDGGTAAEGTGDSLPGPGVVGSLVAIGGGVWLSRRR
ncbi:DUF7345 domain-containing protein [Halopiger aswanensis]|uniref:DUF7345 domain-containing protein n=1 Tax=Halopiger aswanensis TaxID=148449 RepID=A0A419WIZ7_9EURY|nr:hypothetical protein [Halopiger aswanensis]RKD95431.1 hypothetical protein ATJ93_2285 [Halopiger aswanensis]